MNRPIRVAQIMGRMMGGGVEATIMNHYKFIDHDQVQFDFIVQDDSDSVPLDTIAKAGGRVFEIPSYTNLPKYSAACERIFRETKPDIVHSNMNALSVFPLQAAKHAGIPVRIAHSHSTANRNELAKTTIKQILRPFSKVYPTHLAACGVLSAQWLFGKGVVENNAVHYIHNAIDLQKFAYNPEKRSTLRTLNKLDDAVVIGQIGRFSAQKNQTFSIEVFRELHSMIPNAHLVFLGIGDTMDEVKKQVAELGLESSVHFMGLRKDAASWYSAFDVLLFPSLYEGLPLTAIEAQAAGLPIVASDHITEEAFIDHDLISVVPLQANAHTWATRLTEVVKSGKTHERLNTTQPLIDAGYEIRDSAQQLQDWYQAILPKATRS